MAASQTTLEPWAEREVLGDCKTTPPLPVPHVVHETDEITVILAPSHRRRYDEEGRLVWHKIIVYKDENGVPISWSCDCDGQRYKRLFDKEKQPTCVDVNILRWYSMLKKARKRRGVQLESRLAYKHLCASDLGEMQQIVHKALLRFGPCTDRELLNHMRAHYGTGWESNNVWPRRNELMNYYGLVYQVGTKLQESKCRNGSVRVNEVAVWKAVPA